jgi:predicted hotdog family 3-hydroxylacyl-ACP dehydratase
MPKDKDLVLFFVMELAAKGVAVQGLHQKQGNAAVRLQIIGHVRRPITGELNKNTLLHVYLKIGHHVVSLAGENA